MRQGLALGGLAFLRGAVFGPVREVLLAPRLGGVPAAWLEAAGMAAWLWLAAGISLCAPTPARAAIAGVALAVVLAAEAALGLLLSDLAAARAPRGVAEQLPGLLLLAWLVALPFLRRRR